MVAVPGAGQLETFAVPLTKYSSSTYPILRDERTAMNFIFIMRGGTPFRWRRFLGEVKSSPWGRFCLLRGEPETAQGRSGWTRLNDRLIRPRWTSRQARWTFVHSPGFEPWFKMGFRRSRTFSSRWTPPLFDERETLSRCTAFYDCFTHVARLPGPIEIRPHLSRCDRRLETANDKRKRGSD